MKFDSRFADALGQGDLVVNKPGIPKMARLSPRLKHRLVTGGAAALLAFAAGLLVAVFGALAADEPARSRPAIQRAGANSVRAQPTAEQFVPPICRCQRQGGERHRQALSPAYRSGAGDLVGFRLEYSSSRSAKR
jgi:hypothetical protein